VAMVFTGGTISMAADAAAGGNVPAFRGADLVARTPGLTELADLVVVDRGLTPASHFTFDDVLAIAATIRELEADPSIAGVVVVQGTDTLEETSFAWDLLLDSATPVIVTGAMRAADVPGNDGPRNLRDAVAVAASPAMRDSGVCVVLAGTIEPADDVQKTDTTALDTFRSPNHGRLGSVVDGVVRLERPRGPRRHVATDRAAGAVPLISAVLGSDGRDLDALGAGNTAPGLLGAAERAMRRGIPVILASRCATGAVGTAYAFPGGGATWVRAGAIPAGTLCAVKVRVAVSLGLGAGLSPAGLAGLLADPRG
jgi:L-asparaginase